MSRSSPGRYALHEFTKNVYDLQAADAGGRALAVSPITPSQWTVTGHHGSLRVSYRVYGDRVDGTYVSIDPTHAHLNMPASLMWMPGLELRPVRVTFVRPAAGPNWSVATQLFPTDDPLVFTAPNLQFLMDSPAEFGSVTWRRFEEPFNGDGSGASAHMRIALHHMGSDADADDFAAGVKAIVEAERAVYGELPPYENGTYTFLADYLPWANGDGMEHRNSTVLTSSNSLRTSRIDLLDTISHEFFHSWNIERIRPQSLEPFNLEEVNISGELWLGEGFTNYYGALVMKRSGLSTVRAFAQDMGEALDIVVNSPGRTFSSAVQMSQMAPFVDRSAITDRTNFANTFISYYTWGQVIGLGLDLTLRERSDGRVTLDDFMRALWDKYGRPGTKMPGYVETPYTLSDLKSVLSAVSGDAAFAQDFFARYIEGREVMEYAPLLSRAGLVLRRHAAGRAWAGPLRTQDTQTGARVVSDSLFGTPAYQAGLDRDDIIVSIAGSKTATSADVERAIATRKPGDSLQVVYDRHGERITSILKLGEDPSIELVPAEEAGQVLTDAQRKFRKSWLASAARAF